MNTKHIAVAIVAVFAALLVQATLWVRGSKTKMQGEAAAALQQEANAVSNLNRERALLDDLSRQSAGLIQFLEEWQPYFQAVNTPQSAEVNLTMRVRESNLVNLAQRYEQAGVKGNASLPAVMRANLIFEDDYSRLMNWLGRLEKEMPTLRVSNVKLTRGTRPNDLRMELIVDHPLLKQ